MAFDFATYIEVKSTNEDELRATCPFHNDHNPSFSANTKTGLWKCHAGCGQGNYAQFLKSLTKSSPSWNETKKSFKRKKYQPNQDFRTVDTYLYQTIDGIYGHKVIRQEDSFGNKRFFQESLDPRGLHASVSKGIFLVG